MAFSFFLRARGRGVRCGSRPGVGIPVGRRSAAHRPDDRPASDRSAPASGDRAPDRRRPAAPRRSRSSRRAALRPSLSITSSRKRCRPTGSPASTVIVGSRVVIGVPDDEASHALVSRFGPVRDTSRRTARSGRRRRPDDALPSSSKLRPNGGDPGARSTAVGRVLVGDDHQHLVRRRPVARRRPRRSAGSAAVRGRSGLSRLTVTSTSGFVGDDVGIDDEFGHVVAPSQLSAVHRNGRQPPPDVLRDAAARAPRARPIHRARSSRRTSRPEVRPASAVGSTVAGAVAAAPADARIERDRPEHEVARAEGGHVARAPAAAAAADRDRCRRRRGWRCRRAAATSRWRRGPRRVPAIRARRCGGSGRGPAASRSGAPAPSRDAPAGRGTATTAAFSAAVATSSRNSASSSTVSVSLRISVSPTIELPLWCRPPGRSGSCSSARSTPSSVARSRRSRKCSSSTISPPRTPPPVATSSASGEPAPRAVPARERRRGAQPVAPPFRRQRRFEGDTDPAGQPFEIGLGDDRGIGDQVCVGDAIFERRQHAFEVREESREEVRLRGARPVDADRVGRPARTRRQLEASGLIRRPASGSRPARRERTAARPGACGLQLGGEQLPTACRPRRARRHARHRSARPARRAPRRPRRSTTLAIQAWQVVFAVVEAARVRAQRRDVRAAASVAEQLDPHPQVAADEPAHARAGVLDQAVNKPRRSRSGVHGASPG